MTMGRDIQIFLTWQQNVSRKHCDDSNGYHKSFRKCK